MTHQVFTQKYNGRFVDWDKRFGFQCVDLMRQYIEEVKGYDSKLAVPPAATAKQIFLNFRDNKFYKKVLNSPTNAPKQGDIVFWGTYPFVTGWAGHVAICETAGSMSMITFDQNYPTGKPCLFVRHSYKGVMGWLTPVK